MRGLKLGRILAVVLVTGLMVPVAGSATAVPMAKYKSCKQLHKKFPSGLAVSKSSAEYAVDRGMQRPAVRTRLFYRVMGRLKQDVGVVCPVAALVEIPQTPVGFEVSITGETYVYLDWDEPYDQRPSAPTYEVRGPGAITSQFSGSAKVEELEPGITYEFLLVAVNSAGESPPAVLSVATRARPEYEIPDTGTPEPMPTFESGYSSAGYYSTCADARGAGVALPIRDSEQPDLYYANTHLDRDGDGVSCEWG